jgi:hypothetical protein
MDDREAALYQGRRKGSVRMPEPQANGREGNGRSPDEQTLEEIRQSLRGLQFGSLLIIVQDGVVVQIDRTEKKRLPRNGKL